MLHAGYVLYPAICERTIVLRAPWSLRKRCWEKLLPFVAVQPEHNIIWHVSVVVPDPGK